MILKREWSTIQYTTLKKKNTNTEPECLTDEANDQNNGNDKVMEVHDSYVIDSCVVVAEDGQDVPAPYVFAEKSGQTQGDKIKKKWKI